MAGVKEKVKIVISPCFIARYAPDFDAFVITVHRRHNYIYQNFHTDIEDLAPSFKHCRPVVG